MQLLNNKKKLSGPNFCRAPWYKLQLSGTSIEFRSPSRTVSDIHELFPQEWNIYDDKKYNLWRDESGGTAILYKNGWHFRGGLFARKMGTLHIQMVLKRRMKNRNSLFDPRQFTDWICETAAKSYGKINKRILEEQKQDNPEIDERDIKEKFFIRYPKCDPDIGLRIHNGSFWRYYETFYPGFQKHRHYCLAISDCHAFHVIFEASAINCHYFDPRHNLDEAVEDAIEMFMDNMCVTLSPDAQKQADAVRSLYNETTLRESSH